jgi:hypothetical protein
MLADIMAHGKSEIGSFIRPGASVEDDAGWPVINRRAFAAAQEAVDLQGETAEESSDIRYFLRFRCASISSSTCWALGRLARSKGSCCSRSSCNFPMAAPVSMPLILAQANSSCEGTSRMRRRGRTGDGGESCPAQQPDAQ